jgi:hypothetical protein
MTAIPSIGGSVGLAFALALSSPVSAAYQGTQGDLLPPDVKIDWFGPKETAKTKAAPKEPVRKAGSPELLQRMLGNRRVTFLKVDRYFLPSNKGKDAAILDSNGGWLAFVGSRLQAWYPEIEESAREQARARMVDLTAESAKAFLVPGLCDADSRFFRSSDALKDAGQNLATPASATISLWEKGWEGLPLGSGVTTLFVPAGTSALSSGHGALIGLSQRPLVLQSKGGLSYRISNLTTRGTNLSRDRYVLALDKAFEGAEKYKEAKEKHEKDLKEYKKKRKEFLAYYKKNPMKKADKNSKAAKAPSSKSKGRKRAGLTPAELAQIRKLPPSQQRKAMQDLMRKKAGAQAKAGPKTPKAGSKTTAKSGKAPKRPKFPKRVKPNPQNEVLLSILDDKSFLRVEVHRAAEIRALLELKKKHALDKIVLVGATEAWKLPKVIAKSGAIVLLRPEALPGKGYDLLAEHLPAQAALLSKAQVPVCFGSAGRQEAGSLPLLAARAVAHGMSPTQALESLTKTAWLASGGQGNAIVVFSEDPLSPSARVLCVLDSMGLRQPGGPRQPGGK